MSQPPTYAAPDRFAVSHLGMREIHAGRPPWQLLKELVQNVWDEAPAATVCEVDIYPANTGEDLLEIRVEDDGPGFADIADAWTLMKHTPKRENPLKRGRFNLGEKELVSVAVEAVIETAGHTVRFPRIGGRQAEPNRRERGTVVTALMPWPVSQAEDLIQRLKRFRPNGCRLAVNGEEVPEREPELIRNAILDTVIYDETTGAMKRTRRKTEIHLLKPIEQPPWLYEMGIPVQQTAAAYDIDVQQKIPMPPNRNTVSESYLADIYAEALNAAHLEMAEGEFGEQWIKTAMEDPRVESEAVRSVFEGRYGDRALMTSSDRDANLKAAEEGYELINQRSLSPTEKKRFQEDAGLQTSHQRFGRTVVPSAPIPELEETRYEEFADWVKRKAAVCNLRARVEFIEAPLASTVADCTTTSRTPLLRFNVAHPALGESFFKPPFDRREQLELVIHELGHALSEKPGHGPGWGEGVAAAGAMIAAGALREPK